METGCFSKKSSNQDLLLLHFMDNNFFSVLWIVFTWSLFTIENRWWWTPDIYLEENRKAISWPSRTLRTILLKPQKIFFMKALLRNIHSISWGLFLKLLSPPSSCEKILTNCPKLITLSVRLIFSSTYQWESIYFLFISKFYFRLHLILRQRHLFQMN